MLQQVTNIGIDYLTVRLPADNSFTFDDFFELVESEVEVDQTTGHVQSAIYPHQYATRTLTGGVAVIMFFCGGEEFGMRLARNYSLRVTRLDIAVDLLADDENDQQELTFFLAKQVDLALATRGWTVAKSTWTNKGDAVNGRFGHSFWSRAGSKLLRIYGKQPTFQTPNGQVSKHRVRIEWELKQDLARQVWDLLAEPDARVHKILFDCFQTLVSNFLSDDLFQLGSYEARDLSKLPKPDGHNSYEYWLMHTVCRSVAGAFIDTGIDYCAMMAVEIQRLIGNQELEKHRRIVTKNQRARKATKLQFEQQTARRRTKAENDANLKEAMRKMEAENDDNE